MPHTGGNSVCPETVFRYLMQRDESLLVNISKGGVSNLIHSPTQASRNKNVFFSFFFRKRRNIIRWFMIGGLLRRLVHLSIIIRKKKSKDGSKERTGYKAMECVFGNGYAPMDGWVRRSKRNRPAHLIIGCEERESLFSLSSPGPSKRKTTKTR